MPARRLAALLIGASTASCYDPCDSGCSYEVTDWQVTIYLDHEELPGDYLYVLTVDEGTHSCELTVPLLGGDVRCDSEGPSIAYGTDDDGLTLLAARAGRSDGHLKVTRDGEVLFDDDIDWSWRTGKDECDCTTTADGNTRLEF